MDNLDEKQKGQKNRTRISGAIKSAIDERRERPYSIAYDAAVFLIALIFARRHLLFGAHPLSIAMLAVLPSYVWTALFGAVVGAFTLGGAGYVYAIISVIVVFIRIVTSGNEKSGDELFSESLALRMAAALIGGFTAAIYELLLAGFLWGAVLFGLAMTLLPPVLVFLSSGLFTAGLTPASLFLNRRAVFDLSGKKDKEKYNIVFFQCSAAAVIFFVGLALSDYSVIGISAAYIFAGALTLFCAKRFGAQRAAVAGFFSVLGISATNAVAFALSGIASGALFSVGAAYATVGGGIALAWWSAYSGGLSALLEVVPEYSIAAALSVSFLKKNTTGRVKTEEKCPERQAKDMVGTMALSYTSNHRGALSLLEESLLELSGFVKRFSEGSVALSKEDYRAVVMDAVLSYCRTCPGYPSCRVKSARPYEELAEKIAEKLAAGARVMARDFDTVPSFCHMSNRMFEVINEHAARAAAERFRAYGTNTSALDLELFARLIGDAQARDESERELNTAMSELLLPIANEYGPKDCVIRVYGNRRYHLICAGEDADGTEITAPKFKERLEGAMGVKLSLPEYFRNGSCVLMQTDAAVSYLGESAFAATAGRDGEISGDTVRTFESRDGRFYALLSDGMGTGKIAKETSDFVSSFLVGVLNTVPPSDSVLRILSHIIRSRSTECSATVDLFSLDLITKEAEFLKSGAAPSYIKRKESIFRIRSETAPIGLMKTVDAERIRVGVDEGDYIIMLSDGVSQATEDAPWLLEILTKPPKPTVSEYAEFILEKAKEHSKLFDDMTVLVVKIKKA